MIADLYRHCVPLKNNARLAGTIPLPKHFKRLTRSGMPVAILGRPRSSCHHVPSSWAWNHSSYSSLGNGFGIPLDMAVKMWPSPRDEESWLARHAAGKVATPPLALAARMLPTPSSGGESGGPHGIRGGSWAKERLVETFGEEDAVAMSGGSLSPDWTSWLMGIPIGWTSLEPLSQEDYAEWFQAQLDGTWWQEERGLPRIATGIPDRVNRLKCLGNGIVPASLALFLTTR